jgi:hypothetical protein
MLSQLEKPAKRPEGLPIEILWSSNDIHFDLDAAPSPGNDSRPPIANIIRKPNGSAFFKEEWEALLKTVQLLYRAHLEPLSTTRNRPMKLSELKTYHREALMTAVKELEAAAPAVGFCSFHWKAYHLFRHHIHNKSGTANRAKKNAQAKKKSSTTAEPKEGENSHNRSMPQTDQTPANGVQSPTTAPQPEDSARPPLVPINPRADNSSAKRKAPEPTTSEDREPLPDPEQTPAKRARLEKEVNSGTQMSLVVIKLLLT